MKLLSGNRSAFLGAAAAAAAMVAVCLIMTGDHGPPNHVTISFQTLPARGTREFREVEEIIHLFRRERPEIHVKLLPDAPRERHLIVRRTLAEAPDILEVPLASISALAEKGRVVELGDVFSRELGELFPSALAAAQYNNAAYAVPFRAASTQLIYNGAILLKAGYLTEDPLLNNWSELLETCRAIRRSAHGRICWPLGIDGGEPDALANLGAMLAKQTEAKLLAFGKHEGMREFGDTWRVALNNDAGVYALTMLQQLGEHVPPEALHWSREDLLRKFIAGHVAMFFGDARALSRVRTAAPGIQVRAIEAPIDRTRASCVEFYGAVMTPTARHRDACKKLLAYLCSAQAQNIIMTGGSDGHPVFAPVREDLLYDPWYNDHPDYKPFVKALRYPSAHTRVQAWGEVRKQAFVPELRKVLSGETDVEAAAQNIEGIGNNVLSTYYGYIGHASETTVLGMSIIGIGVFLLVFFTVGHRAKH